MKADHQRLLRTHWADLTDDEREIVREAERRVGHLSWCLGDTPGKACARKLAPVLDELAQAQAEVATLRGEVERLTRGDCMAEESWCGGENPPTPCGECPSCERDAALSRVAELEAALRNRLGDEKAWHDTTWREWLDELLANEGES